MRLLSLEVDNFRALRSARLSFGPGLNIVYGPNDLGKSTLSEAIRAALLVVPGSAETRSYVTWGAPPGVFPKVLMTFECEGAIWRVEKFFAQGSRIRAQLEKSTDGGARYHTHAQGRDVEGKLRELLSWGLSAPGGRGSAQRSETYLTTALLGRQGAVDAIFEASLRLDPDETGRALVTKALNVLGQNPVVTQILDRLRERSGEAYTTAGRHKRTSDSPLVKARAQLKEREERLRLLEDSARRGREIEEDVRRLLREREAAIVLRDSASAELARLREHALSNERGRSLEVVIGEKTRDLGRITRAFRELEVAREDHDNAQAALAVARDELTAATREAEAADVIAQVARNKLAESRAHHESSREIAASVQAARVAELRVRLERAVARKTHAQSVGASENQRESLQLQLGTARIEVGAAQREAAHASAELKLSSVSEELREALSKIEALDAAVSDHERQVTRERASEIAVGEADAAVKAAFAALERARDEEEMTRRGREQAVMNLRLQESRIILCESKLREAREALQRLQRAVEAQAAAAVTDARLVEIGASLTANAAEIQDCEGKLALLESIALELRRQAIEVQVDELSAHEADARDRRRKAVESRDLAANLEAERAGSAIERSKKGFPFVAGFASAVVGYLAMRYAVSMDVTPSAIVAVMLGLLAGVIVTLAGARRPETGSAETNRNKGQRLGNAVQLRSTATELDRYADALFESCANLPSLRRDLARLTERLAALDSRKLASQSAPFTNGRADLNSAVHSARDRLENVRIIRETLLTQRLDQLANGVSNRTDVIGSAIEFSEAHLVDIDPASDMTEAARRVSAVEAELSSLDQEADRLKDLSSSPLLAQSQIAVSNAKHEVVSAENALEDSWRERHDAIEDLAHTRVRLETARRHAEGINMLEIQQRVLSARAEFGKDTDFTSVDLAKKRHEQAKERLSTATVTFELLREREAAARQSYDLLGWTLAGSPHQELAEAEDEDRRLRAEIQNAEANLPLSSDRADPSHRELAAVGAEAHRAEEELIKKRSRVERATARRNEIRASAERAWGDHDACVRQVTGMDIDEARRGLDKACQELADLPSFPSVTPESLTLAQTKLEGSEHDLKACETSFNEMRGKLELVMGRVGLDRLEEEREAVQRAMEHAEDQEFEYDASRYLLELLEEEETKRSSHLGRSLAAPVAERFAALTEDLYGRVHLDPDLRLEGFVVAGSGPAAIQHNVGELSVGTREQLATIIRLAISEQLKTAVILDDQLVHSDSRRLEWFRKQIRNSVRDHDHQVIVITCRLADYAGDGEIIMQDRELVRERSLTIITALDAIQPHNVSESGFVIAE